MAQVRERAIVARRLAVDLAAATLFAVLTAVGARLSFHVPFTPVPITGQVLCVLLAGGVLGARLGFVSQVEDLAAGAAGLPIFAHGGGPAALLGPTGGYLVGFPLAALVVGSIAGRSRAQAGWRVLLACLCGVIVIHACGAAWFAVWRAMTGSGAGLLAVLAQSLFPFVAVDAVKAAAAAALIPAMRRRLPPG
jgi:biotin transport system substrate-specific component